MVHCLYNHFFSNPRILWFSIGFLLLFTLSGTGQDSTIVWQEINSQTCSNINQIFRTSTNTAIAISGDIIQMKNEKWEKMLLQPPRKIGQLFALNNSNIFISSNTKYQESELYYWNGKSWTSLYHPLASSINCLFFTNKKNGVIGGLGEIALLQDNKWRFLSPPCIGSLQTLKVDTNNSIWALSLSGKLYYYDKQWHTIISNKLIKQIKLFKNKIYVLGTDYIGIVSTNKITKITIDTSISKANTFGVVNESEFFIIKNNGQINHFREDKWNKEETNINNNLYDIICNDTIAWCVGNNGKIIVRSNKYFDHIPINNCNGFKQFTHKSNAKLVDDEYGVVAADFNNDGLTDIFTCGLYEANHIYINKGENQFVEEAEKWGIAGLEKNHSSMLNLGACAVDIDNDGDMDLYVTALNGANKIFENIKGAKFIDYSNVTGGTGEKTDRTNASIFGDIDNDGDLDLYITNEYSTNRLYLNNGVGVFEEATSTSGLETKNGGMGCVFGDIDNDGDLDLYVTNWSRKNILYKNMLKETGQLSFKNITKTSRTGGMDYSKSNGVVFWDIDTDGDLDLFVANRKTSNRLYINEGNGIYKDRTIALIGLDSFKTNGVVIDDLNGDGKADIYLANVGPNIYYKGMKTGQFKIETDDNGLKTAGYSTGLAKLDMDNDGDIDMYLSNYVGESSTFLVNQKNNKKFIQLSLSGIRNNKNAIGARISIYQKNNNGNGNKLIDYRQVSGGSGYASMNSLIQTISLENDNQIDIKVQYPDGKSQIIKNLMPGSLVEISDLDGLAASFYLFKKWIQRRFFDPHEFFELLKWIFVIVLVSVSHFYGVRKYDWSLINAWIGSGFVFLIYLFQYYYHEYDLFLYATILPLISVVGFILITYLYSERLSIKKQALREEDQIRTKLSRDLHDDLASTISTIGIYLTLLRYNINDPKGKLPQLINTTEKLVNTAAISITDLIWAINPRTETIENLLIRVQKNFNEILREKNIQFKIEYKENEAQIMLSPKYKQNIYLIIKEAINNSLKYASPSIIEIALRCKESRLHIILRDYGVGFEINQHKNKGHGLINMKQRADEMGTKLTITSILGEGTICTLDFGDTYLCK